jgi:hypothetical protein
MATTTPPLTTFGQVRAVAGAESGRTTEQWAGRCGCDAASRLAALGGNVRAYLEAWPFRTMSNVRIIAHRATRRQPSEFLIGDVCDWHAVHVERLCHREIARITTTTEEGPCESKAA